MHKRVVNRGKSHLHTFIFCLQVKPDPKSMSAKKNRILAAYEQATRNFPILNF